MYISKVAVNNFRVFDGVGIVATFNRGVNAIIGENNCGKSALIDAIRIAFSTVPYKKDIYFNKSDFHVSVMGEVSRTAQVDIYFDEISEDFFDIWNPEDTTKGEFHVKYHLVPTANGLEKVRYSVWGGPVEGNAISQETFESLEVMFLGALRDAENELKPTRTSKLASLLGTVANDEKSRSQLVEILKTANSNILSQDAITKMADIINTNLSTIEQEIMQQKIAIGLVEPKFESIASSLRTWLKPRWFYITKNNPNYKEIFDTCSETEWNSVTEEEPEGIYLDLNKFLNYNKTISQTVREFLNELSEHSLELYQNGLGYNNILYMSAVLGDMTYIKPEIQYSLLIVEEPEAHLHPQLQELVHSFFENNSSSSSNIQVFYTSHSPTLVSRIGIDKINILYEERHRVNCLRFSQSKLDDTDRAYLERFLDVTKSQMLFAKGIVFVEGISEALLIPEMALLLSRPLDRYAVEIVNINGVSFKPFANLLTFTSASSCHPFLKAAIITDDDRCTRKNKNEYISKETDFDTEDLIAVRDKLSNGTPSDRFNEIKALCSGANISLYGAKKTFEYELSLIPSNIPHILDALVCAYPNVGLDLKKKVYSLLTMEEKATCIWLFIQNRSKSKGSFAQALSKTLHKQYEEIKLGKPPEKPFCVPQYIRNAIFQVTKKEATDDKIVNS